MVDNPRAWPVFAATSAELRSQAWLSPSPLLRPNARPDPTYTTMAVPFMGATVRSLPLVLGALLFGASCSSSSDGGADELAASVVQNLLVDPDGRTVTVDITGAVGDVSTGSVEASGGQVPLNVVRTGDSVAIEFDSRVTPEHQVRIINVEGVASGLRNVTTTDDRQVQLAIPTATQDTSDNELGGDTIEALFFSGPRVVRSQVEDLDNWTVTVGGLNMNLIGSEVDFDADAQRAVLTLGPLANLFSDFTVSVDAESVAAVAVNPGSISAVATGDSVPPALEGSSPVVQNVDPLAEGDEFGRTIEIDFGEPINPVFGAQPFNFSVADHPAAVGMTSVDSVVLDALDPSRVRVLFSRPVVPGLDQIVIDGVVDAHGNPFPAESVALENLAPQPNSFESVEFITREGLNNDLVVAVLNQAIDPDTADVAAHWSLQVGSNTVDLTEQEISYDLTAKTVSIELGFDALNGETADLASFGATNIDGGDFSVTAAQVTAAGDAAPPELSGVIQNRNVDSEGTTVDVMFSEALDFATATDTSTYTFNPPITVDGAVLVDGSTVRLELASVAIPGDVSLTVGATVADPAGNSLGSPAGPAALTSTDTIAPSPSVAAARAIEGLDNDVVTVLFSDTLVADEVETISSWNIESPVGVPIDLSNASVTYNAGIGTADVVLLGPDGAALLGGDDFQVSLTTMRDIGGNSIDLNPIGGPVIAESNRPALEAAFAVSGGTGDQIILRFSEPMGNLEDLFNASSNPTGVRYVQVAPVSGVETLPESAVSIEGGLGVLLTYADPVNTLGTLNIVGVTDLAGNLLFPVLNLHIAAENLTVPAFAQTPELRANSGIDNDTLSIQFNTPMSTWRLLDPAQYTLRETASGDVIDLASAMIEFDGIDTVTFGLNSSDLPEFTSALAYDVVLNVDATNPLRSVQGVPIATPETEASVSVVGDTLEGPMAAMSFARIDPLDSNALIVVFSETVDLSFALDPSGYSLNGVQADSVTEVSPRTVRAAFNVAPNLGETLEIQAANAVDSAGNEAPGLMSIAVTGDLTAPSIDSVTATVVEGFGGDTIEVTFNEELDAALAASLINYTAMGDGVPIRVTGALYSSNDFTATLFVNDMPNGATIAVEVVDVADVLGNVPGAALLGSSTALGDDVAPSVASAVVNLGEDADGLVIDVLFSEGVANGFASDANRWSATGQSFVLAVDVLSPEFVRLHLSNSLAANGTLTLDAGLSDYAGNVVDALVINPTE